MSYVIVPTRFGQRIAHSPDCSAITQINHGQQIHLLLEDGALLCNRCHGRPFNRITPSVQHPTLPVGIYTLGPRGLKKPLCCPACESGVKRVRKSAWWQCTGCTWRGRVLASWAWDGNRASHHKPAGRYTIENGVCVPVECPSCQSAYIERLGDERAWTCMRCEWYGKVFRSVWTLVERRHERQALPTGTSDRRAIIHTDTRMVWNAERLG